jgi:phage terminase small subunit
MPKTPPVPSHFSARAETIWRETLAEFDMSPSELAVFRLALEAVDRANQARRALRDEGLWRTNRFGDLVPHPAVKVERDAAAARFIAQLGLPEPEEETHGVTVGPLRGVS